MTNLLRPNPSSGVPIYLQLVDQVKAALQSGALRPGDELPDVRPLARDLVVHPNAVARAYRTLEAEGLLTQREGAAALLTVAAAEAGAIRAAELLTARDAPSTAATSLTLRDELTRRDRELDVAREVQERLFPQDCPAMPGLDYAGASRPALGVGGDYYDFIQLADTTLGIAIGDISGKGMPAALLMATLRAFLRGQTLHGATNLADLMATLNHLVYECSAANRYATCFYAQFHADTRVLEYVNAGHNAPMVLRVRDGGTEVLRLDATGPVIGLIADCMYGVRRITLEPGDRFVAFTDGVSESMNAAYDEWGEDRLASALERHASSSPRALIADVMRDADAHAAGAPQHDDMTIVAALIS
jgi:sigma-B regulation protein RsbU (phosphoserine phosphatase)